MERLLNRQVSSLLFFIQFVPLSVFAAYANLTGSPSPQRWLEAFAIGTALVVVRFGIMRWRRIQINPLILGTDLYLLFGLIACLSGHPWLTDPLASARETGVLIAIFCIGLISTVYSQRGFVLAEGRPRREVVRASLMLLLIAAVGIIASYVFRGHTLYSAVLPIVALAISQRGLRYRLRKNS